MKNAAKKKAFNWEQLFGITLAIFAAVLAINDMGGGRYGEDEVKLTNEKSNQYLWYQSKGIKESLAEGQQALLETLIHSGAIVKSQQAGLNEFIAGLQRDVARYKKEKKEILLGSAAVGKENWVQDVGGEFGKVVGAKEMEDKITKLAAAGDRFDVATLLLQISLVVGAIGLLVKEDGARRTSLFAMLALGSLGSVFSVLGFLAAWAA